MKKKIVGVVIMAAIAVTAGWNMSQSENNVKLADLTLSNVEALARGEGSGGYCSNPGYMCIIRYSDGSSSTVSGKWN